VNTGLGISEIALIFVLVLVFFGSKEIPQFVRVVAKLMAKVRFYTDKVKREFDSVTQSLEPPSPQGNLVIAEKKALLRKQYILLRKELTDTSRKEKSQQISDHLQKSPYFSNVTTIMMYAHIGCEVETRDTIDLLLRSGKRVVLPYFKDSTGELGISEIHDSVNGLQSGAGGFPEVPIELRKPFFKSDLQLIVCPGVAFDSFGARLGRGKSFYDRFLRELKGQVPIVGLAFDCQICKESLPFEYHDVIMDQIITENGMLLPVEIERILTIPEKTTTPTG
jgi:5-formyltetrahydrofolate cyclo-ligase